MTSHPWSQPGYLLIRIGIVVLGGEAPHEVAIIAAHHLLHMFELTRGRGRRAGCSFGSQRPRRGSGVRRGWGRTSGRWTIVVGCIGGCIGRPTASYSGRRGGGSRGCGCGGAQSFCFHERVVIVVAIIIIVVVVVVMIGCIGGAVHCHCDAVVPRNSSAATLSPRLGWRQSDGSRSCRRLLVVKIGCSWHSLRIALTFPWNNQNTDWTSDNTYFTMYIQREQEQQ